MVAADRKKTYLLLGIGVAVAAGAGCYFYYAKRRHHRHRHHHHHSHAKAALGGKGSQQPDHPAPMIKHKSLTIPRDNLTDLFTSEQIKAIWDEFNRHSVDGAIQRDEFTRIFRNLGIEDETVIESTFKTFDTGGNGKIEFNELCQVLMIISGGTREMKLRLMFSMMDPQKTGRVNMQQLTRLYESTLKAGGEAVDQAALQREIREVFKIAHSSEGAPPHKHPFGATISEEEFVKLANFEVMNLETGGVTQQLLTEFGVASK